MGVGAAWRRRWRGCPGWRAPRPASCPPPGTQVPPSQRPAFQQGPLPCHRSQPSRQLWARPDGFPCRTRASLLEIECPPLRLQNSAQRRDDERNWTRHNEQSPSPQSQLPNASSAPIYEIPDVNQVPIAGRNIQYCVNCRLPKPLTNDSPHLSQAHLCHWHLTGSVISTLKYHPSVTKLSKLAVTVFNYSHSKTFNCE